jgi:hypothetical protein
MSQHLVEFRTYEMRFVLVMSKIVGDNMKSTKSFIHYENFQSKPPSCV